MSQKDNVIRIMVTGTRGIPEIQGGVERHCQSLYPRMKGVDITIARRRPYINRHTDISWPSISYLDLPSTRIKGFEAVWHTFLATIVAIFRRPDIVHTHNIGPGLFIPLLKLFRIPVVMTYHSANYEHAKWGKAAKRLLRFAESVSLRYADHIIFVNKAKRATFSQKILDKSTWMPNGVESQQHSSAHDKIDSFGLKPGEYLLAVGRITPEKGFEYLVQAVQDMPAVSQVAIVGGADHDTEYLDRLHALDKKGKAVFTGALTGEALRQLYSHARLFVLSSVNEGFPLVLLEAMAYKLPVIASDIPATDIPQLQIRQKFRAGDVMALRQAITSALAVDATVASYDLTEYNWEKIAARTEQILRQNTRK